MKIKIISIFLCLAVMQQNYGFLRKQTFFEQAQYILGIFSNSSNKLGYLTTNKTQNENQMPSLPNDNTSFKVDRDALRSFLDSEFQENKPIYLNSLTITKELFQLLDNNGSEAEISRYFNELLDIQIKRVQGNEANHLLMDICSQHLPQNEFCIEHKKIIENNKNYYSDWYQKIYGVPLKTN